LYFFLVLAYQAHTGGRLEVVLFKKRETPTERKKSVEFTCHHSR